jgi:molybdenum cofactor biosynthesis enzyme MoaA
MHPLLPDFISGARDILDDVGVTTNGTYLERKLTSIVRAGLRRIHISLQAESLCDPSGVKRWIIPGWLAPVLDLGREGVLNVRLNLPVPLQDLSLAREFLKELSPFQCGVNLFSILPKSECAIESRGDKALKELAVEENSRRELNSIAGKIIVRGYRAPTGIRCASCAEQKMCREQSHSLRLGVDRTLRPCLATRQWDIRSMDENDLGADIEAASLLALDYAWEG